MPRALSAQPFTHKQGLAAGLTTGRLEGADLGRPFHGIRHPDNGSLTTAQRCQAYSLIMAHNAFFSSVTAAQLMTLPLPARIDRETDLHVAVPSPTRSSKAAGVIGHKVKLMGGDFVTWNGLRHSSPERAWCELAEVLRLDDLVAVGDHLIHGEYALTTVERLRDAVERYPGMRGIATLRAAAALLDARAESAMESRTRLILARAALPPCEPNFWVQTPAARYRLDFAFPGYQSYVEYQGNYHFDIDQQRRDMTRRSRLDAIDWRGIEINVRDLDDPAELTARVAGFLRLRGWRG